VSGSWQSVNWDQLAGIACGDRDTHLRYSLGPEVDTRGALEVKREEFDHLLTRRAAIKATLINLQVIAGLGNLLCR